METDELAHAFNLGCDARLHGLPIDSWRTLSDSRNEKAAMYFRTGWRHVDKFWGCERPGSAKPLPVVRVP